MFRQEHCTEKKRSFREMAAARKSISIPATQNKEKPEKRCIVCYKNNVRRESRYHCEQCVTNPGLCAAPCFLRYHTLINYEYAL